MNRRVYGFISLAIFIALSLYSLQLPEAGNAKEITYVSEVKANPDAFANRDIILMGDTRYEDGIYVFEDGTGSMELSGDMITGSTSLIYGRYRDGRLVADTVHSIPFTKSLYIAIGGVIVIFSFLIYWKFDSRINIIER